MNSYLIKKSALSGEVTIPSSKSESLRAILFASLAKNTSVIYDPLFASDTKSMIDACRLFGATIDICENKLHITGIDGKINTCDDVINAGNSGIVLRFCSSVAALSKHPIVITGDASIRHQRPMKNLLNALSDLNVKAVSTKGDGFAPIIVQGPINHGKVHVSGEDSQPVSALLIASIFANGPIELFVKNPGEKPWVNLTLSWFERLNIPYKNHDFNYYQTFGNASYEGFHYFVPGDLSTLAFPVAAALITQSEITIKNVDMDQPQGDKELIHTFIKMGALIDIDSENKTIHVRKTTRLSGISVDINDFVDSVTILAAVACYATGETHIQNCLIAKQKESDRLTAVVTELKKMGADIKETKYGLVIKQSNLKGASLYSHNDHRLCMSLSIAALGASGETKISDVSCVNKTYPQFLSDFQKLKCNIQLTEK